MSQIKIERISDKKKNELSLPDQPEDGNGWSVWECLPSTFDWTYDRKELAYIYQGKVIVKTSSEKVVIQAGDYVTFPQGLSCQWNVIEKIRKVYKFE